VDLSILVEAQGELLDNIEHSVGQSLNCAEKGVEELEKASECQEGAQEAVHPHHHRAGHLSCDGRPDAVPMWAAQRD